MCMIMSQNKDEVSYDIHGLFFALGLDDKYKAFDFVTDAVLAACKIIEHGTDKINMDSIYYFKI